jgi:hypothetical protein
MGWYSCILTLYLPISWLIFPSFVKKCAREIITMECIAQPFSFEFYTEIISVRSRSTKTWVSLIYCQINFPGLYWTIRSYILEGITSPNTKVPKCFYCKWITQTKPQTCLQIFSANYVFWRVKSLNSTHRSANIASYILVVLNTQSFCCRNCFSHIAIAL